MPRPRSAPGGVLTAFFGAPGSGWPSCGWGRTGHRSRRASSAAPGSQRSSDQVPHECRGRMQDSPPQPWLPLKIFHTPDWPRNSSGQGQPCVEAQTRTSPAAENLFSHPGTLLNQELPAQRHEDAPADSGSRPTSPDTVECPGVHGSSGRDSLSMAPRSFSRPSQSLRRSGSIASSRSSPSPRNHRRCRACSGGSLA